MSDIETTTATDAEGRTAQAKQMIGQAGQALKSEAQSFATAAQERARAEARKGTETATKTLGDFANAIRRAGDELSSADQSPAARLIGQAADGLESLSRNLAGKEPEDLLNDVRGFARSHPMAFIGGAVLVGVALGRFARASETNAYSADYAASLADEAVSPFPAADTSGLVGAEATGAEALGLAEEDGFDGEAEFAGVPTKGSLEAEIGDDLGDLQPSDVDDTSGPQGGPRSV